ncbi:hypothetical protein OK016_19255 [Vibrio chagasii]|nr:hypothetical protein [Vibrio chagasii]
MDAPFAWRNGKTTALVCDLVEAVGGMGPAGHRKTKQARCGHV